MNNDPELIYFLEIYILLSNISNNYEINGVNPLGLVAKLLIILYNNS